METSFFLYRSRTELTARSSGCADILAASRSRNQAFGLTGYLHLEDGCFYQWLEGPPNALAEVGQMITGDRRHWDVDFIWQGTQPDRRFRGWEMGFGTSNAGTLFDWVAEQGIQVSDQTSFSRGLLDFMLSELRGLRSA
ncbi:MAG TPA: BLUF domain-containing protein [Paracoccus sp. (in: a-proteobacteria)]|uniref:BLUF domain-containing protein n=1 Tax=Paracoccus sp. TaxID=267 RepID=UPI002BB7B73D|nr:BLUF domain-containing protein [Paracoccus sp. (in: a-proteobacteria)]HWL59087.1 BLUF domain-containing protein [Paracoccus sp. (in: a-proteobacteria)]